MPRIRGGRYSVVVVVVVLASMAVVLVGVPLFVSPRQRDALSAGNEIAGMIGVIVAVAALVVPIMMRARPADDPAMLVRAREELVRRITDQWRRESYARGLSPRPINVAWSSAGVADAAVDPQAPRRLRGDVAGIAAAFRELPTRQLVIIGNPEFGKTSLAGLVGGALFCGLAGG